VFTIRLFLKSQRKNLEGLFAGFKHSMFFTFLAIFEKHPENLQGLSCLGSRKICRISTLLNNNPFLICISVPGCFKNYAGFL